MSRLLGIALVLISLLCIPALGGSCHLFLFNALPAGSVFLDVLYAVIFFVPFLVLLRYRTPENRLSDPGQDLLNCKWTRMLSLSFAAMMALGIIIFAMLSIQAPHGEWDARAIWNLHARFLFRGMEHWGDYLTPLLHWSHPDYPLLLPAAVARMWLFLGCEYPAVPIGIAFVFTFATVALLVGGVTILHGKIKGLLAGILLLGSKNFIAQGASQYADVPLAFFYLAWAIIISLSYTQSGSCRAALIYLSFLLAACAAWTKNEGLLFLLAAVVVYVMVNLSSSGDKKPLAGVQFLIAGCLPVLILVIVFKSAYAPANDIIGPQGIAETLARITDPQRYLQIGRSFLGEAIRFNNGVGVFMVLFLLLTKPTVHKTRETFTVSTLLTMMIVGYFLVYLISPRNLYFHLGNSLDRISVQLWPTFIFLYFVAFDWKGTLRLTVCGREKNSQ